jgi:hypothetical protein
VKIKPTPEPDICTITPSVFYNHTRVVHQKKDEETYRHTAVIFGMPLWRSTTTRVYGYEARGARKEEAS